MVDPWRCPSSLPIRTFVLSKKPDNLRPAGDELFFCLRVSGLLLSAGASARHGVEHLVPTAGDAKLARSLGELASVGAPRRGGLSGAQNNAPAPATALATSS